jgi:hypothetical protein
MTLAARVRVVAPAGIVVSATSDNDLQSGSSSSGLGVLAETVVGWESQAGRTSASRPS